MNWIKKFKDHFFRRLKKRIVEQNLIEKGAEISNNCYLSGSYISKKVNLAEGVKIYESRIQGNVSIGKFTSIWGPNTTIIANINNITIGNFCSIARNVSIQESNHNIANFSTYHINRNILQKEIEKDLISKGSIQIGNDVWIGAGTVILSGVKIANGVVVGANSVVTKNIPSYAIAAGNPARIIRYRFSPTTVKKIENLKWWDWELEKIKMNKNKLDELVNGDS